jgi:hypothetical protein
MLSTAAGKAAIHTAPRQARYKKSRLVGRKIWLPKLLYDALPYFYLGSGLSAFFATIYITEWFWVVPHYALFSFVCFHLGILVYRRRHRARRENTDSAE